MKVVITGGTGYVGTALSRALVAAGHEVVVLTRGPSGSTAGVRAVTWNPGATAGGWRAELRGAGAVVNLAGASIGGGRWTRRRKQAILASRVEATAAVVDAIRGLAEAEKPAVLVSASGVDYYGDTVDGEVDERAPAGTSFLARVCVQWEAVAARATEVGVRVVLVRTGVAFSRESASLRLMALPFRMFVGGPVGSGRQALSWVHIDDLVGIYMLAIRDASLSGPVNASAPDAPDGRAVAREMGRALHRPALAPAPTFAMRLLLGEMADLLLHGRRAVPAVARQHGYVFRYPTLASGLRESLGRDASGAAAPA
jgi:hypothetical protein